MPSRTPEHVRDAILADIRAGKLSCRAIARAHGVSASTVSQLARDASIPNAFARSHDKTPAREAARETATEARKFDAKAARAQMIEDLYADAQRFRARAWSEYEVVLATVNGVERITTKLPGLRDQQSAYTALAICLDKAVALENRDDDGGASAGRTMINDLFGAFRLAYHQQVSDARGDGEVDLSAATDADPTAAPAEQPGAGA